MKKIKIFTLNKEIEKNVSDKYKSDTPDLIVAIGGDGTLIKAIKKYQHLDIPFYGLANGTLNFLMNEEIEKTFNKNLERISKTFKKIIFKKTPILDFLKNGIRQENCIVNEIVIGDSLRSYQTIKTYTNDGFDKIVKVGMISYSTPLGTTGLNRNIGGEITPYIDVPIYNMVSVAANDNFKKIINEEKHPKEVNFKKLDDRYETLVVVDGQSQLLMHQNDEIEIKLKKYIDIGFEDFDFFQTKRLVD